MRWIGDGSLKSNLERVAVDRCDSDIETGDECARRGLISACLLKSELHQDSWDQLVDTWPAEVIMDMDTAEVDIHGYWMDINIMPAVLPYWALGEFTILEPQGFSRTALSDEMQKDHPSQVDHQEESRTCWAQTYSDHEAHQQFTTKDDVARWCGVRNVQRVGTLGRPR